MAKTTSAPAGTDQLARLAADATGCTACELFRNATQTVFGRGPADARVFLVGEQPGDQEDRAGAPFVGPAGRILDQAMAEAGLRRDAEKFERMVAFARALPGLRERCRQLVAGDGLTRERVLACAIRLLDLGFFRIGGEEYVEQNGSYGLATLCKEHVTLGDGDTLTFDYPAKSGKRRVQTISDEAVFAVVSALKRRRTGGPELFAWKEKGRWVDVRSSDVNDFVKELSGGEFTAKDFRTWAGTVLAAVALAVADGATSRTGRQRAVSRAYQEVAHYLGNTPAVCRKSYVDSRVVDRYRAGVTIADVLTRDDDGSLSAGCAIHGAVEAAVLALLEDAPEPALEAA